VALNTNKQTSKQHFDQTIFESIIVHFEMGRGDMFFRKKQPLVYV
jgi:hypothetical protein